MNWLAAKLGSKVTPRSPRSPSEFTMSVTKGVPSSIPSLTTRSLPSCSQTRIRPSGRSAIAVGFVRPAVTRVSVKPSGRVAAFTKTGAQNSAIRQRHTILRSIARVSRCQTTIAPLPSLLQFGRRKIGGQTRQLIRGVTHGSAVARGNQRGTQTRQQFDRAPGVFPVRGGGRRRTAYPLSFGDGVDEAVEVHGGDRVAGHQRRIP